MSMSVTSLIRRLDQLKRGGERKGDLDGDAVESTRARLRDVATDALRTDLVAADDVKTEDALWNYCYYQPLQVLKRSAAGADAGAGAVEGEGGGGGGGEIQSLLNEATGTYHFLLSCFNDDGAVPAGASSEATSTVAAKQRTDAFVGKCLIRLGDIARYRTDMAGAPAQIAKVYYETAVRSPEAAARAFNQLALVSKAKFSLESFAYYACSLADDPTLTMAAENIKGFWAVQQQKQKQERPREEITGAFLAFIRLAFGHQLKAEALAPAYDKLERAVLQGPLPRDSRVLVHVVTAWTATWYCLHRPHMAPFAAADAATADVLLLYLMTLLGKLCENEAQAHSSCLACISWFCMFIRVHGIAVENYNIPAFWTAVTELANSFVGDRFPHLVQQKEPIRSVAPSATTTATAGPRRTGHVLLANLRGHEAEEEDDEEDSDGEDEEKDGGEDEEEDGDEDEEDDNDQGDDEDDAEEEEQQQEQDEEEHPDQAQNQDDEQQDDEQVEFTVEDERPASSKRAITLADIYRAFREDLLRQAVPQEALYLAAFHPKRPLPATIIPSVASRSDAKNHYVRWRRAAVVNVCLGGSSSIVWDGLQGTFKYFDSSNETREERNARNMKRMAEQRLKTTVNHLERDLRRQTAETRRMTKFVGSHVIVDASVLLGQFTLVKRLVASRQVIVHIPHQAIQFLDDSKKGESHENRTARDAIRFLEKELKSNQTVVVVHPAVDALSLPQLCGQIAADLVNDEQQPCVRQVLLWGAPMSFAGDHLEPSGWRLASSSEIQEIASKGTTIGAEKSIVGRMRELGDGGTKRPRRRGGQIN